MTKKDYQIIAQALSEALKEAEQENDGGLESSGVKTAAFSVASYLAIDNPRFDWEKFLQACGFSGE